MGMTLMVKRDILKILECVCIYIYIDNRLLVVVEFKFLKLR